MDDDLLDAVARRADRTWALAHELKKALLEPVPDREPPRFRFVRREPARTLEVELDADLANTLVGELAGLSVPISRGVPAPGPLGEEPDAIVAEAAPGWQPNLGGAASEREVLRARVRPLDGADLAAHLSHANRLLAELRATLEPVVTATKRRVQLQRHLDGLEALVDGHWPAEAFADHAPASSEARGYWLRNAAAVAEAVLIRQRQRDARPSQPPPDPPAARELAEVIALALEHLCPDEDAIDPESLAHNIRRDRRARARQAEPAGQADAAPAAAEPLAADPPAGRDEES